MIDINNHISEERYKKALEYHFSAILPYFDNEKISDIKVNPNGLVYAKYIDGSSEKLDIQISEASITAVAHLLASNTQNDITEKAPSVAAVWPDPPYRIHIMLPPAVEHAALVIRRFSKNVIPLKAFIENGNCSEEQANKLRELIVSKKNIIVSGETGSGKTTLLNTLINEIPASERLFIIEDTRELNVDSMQHPDVTQVLTGQLYCASDAVKDALRFIPDRIIVGEVRDGAALDMLEAWNTGHPGGLCSLHANSPSTVKQRLSALIRRVSKDPQIETIDTALDAVVQINLCKDGIRRITEIKEFRK